jgi:hypothetical protein
MDIGQAAAEREWRCEMICTIGAERCNVRFRSGDVKIAIDNVPGPFILHGIYSTFDVASLISGVWKREAERSHVEKSR